MIIYVKAMFVYWWSTFRDAGPKLNRHNLNVSCLMGYDIDPAFMLLLSNTNNYILYSWFVYDLL